MAHLDHLFAQNRAWADAIRAKDPEFFPKLSRQQCPEYLWIGCSDSRVPANEIVNLLPGEMFVHRNIANVVVHTDPELPLRRLRSSRSRSSPQGEAHHRVRSTTAAAASARPCAATEWDWPTTGHAGHVQDVSEKHSKCVHRASSDLGRVNVLCELNVIEQVCNVSQTTIARDAWERGQTLTIHSWIYGLKDGLMRNLGMSVSSAKEIEPQYRAALATIESGRSTDTAP